MSRLSEQYKNEIVDAMIKKFGYKNIMEVPKLDKVVINMGVGEAKENAGKVHIWHGIMVVNLKYSGRRLVFYALF